MSVALAGDLAASWCFKTGATGESSTFCCIFALVVGTIDLLLGSRTAP